MTARDSGSLAALESGLGPAVSALRKKRVAAALRRTHARFTDRSPWILAVLLVAAAALAGGFAIPWFLPAAVLLAIWGAALAIAWIAARSRAVRAIEAALANDRAHRSKDRLSAALDLAGGRPGRSTLEEAFAAASIEDGLAWLRSVDVSRVEEEHPTARPSLLKALLCLLALLAMTALLPGPPSRVAKGLAGAGAGPAARIGGRAGRAGAARSPEVAAPNRIQGDPRRGEDAGPKEGEAGNPGPSEAMAAVPASSGSGASGNADVAQKAADGTPEAAPSGNPGAGSSGGGRGSTASEAPKSSPEAGSHKKAPPRKKPKNGARTRRSEPNKAGESAGAPSGPSRGSGNTTPVGNKRQDWERGLDRDEDADVEDEPVEDETEEQEQRGGVTPMRRQDQRPAARELSISGDGPPDQGRGGPTPPKKSRGTASLVLGIRLPDQVRGQPNPGTAKTSIEQVPPRRQAGRGGAAKPAAGGRAGTPQSRRPVLDALQLLLPAYHRALTDSSPEHDLPR
ncbi:MAG: hypothetical protein Fur0037_07030 [Planctomycetota bacterium]